MAKRHLATLLYGFTEHFDDFVARLCAEFDWKKPDYTAVNVSPPYRNQVTKKQLSQIECLNWADMELYAWAREYAC